MECPLISSSATKLVCKLTNEASSLQANKEYQLNVLVKNIGYATYNESFVLKFSPSIISMSPEIGSTAGGTLVTLTGYGFSQLITIVFANQQMDNQFYISEIIEKTFNQIKFKTPEMSDELFDIYVYSITTSVLSLNKLQFNYSSAITPIIDSVDPLEVSSSSLITINGSNFGNDSTNVNVKIGSEVCLIETVNDLQIMCQLKGLNLGPQDILVNINGKFNI